MKYKQIVLVMTFLLVIPIVFSANVLMYTSIDGFTDDVYVYKTLPNDNYGKSASLNIDARSSYVKQNFFKIDLDSSGNLPQNLVVDEAYLHLYRVTQSNTPTSIFA